MFDFLSDGVLRILDSFLNIFPAFDFPIFKFSQTIYDIMSVVWFFLPYDAVTDIFKLTISITILRFTLAVILRIKSFIPTLGG